MSDREAQAPGPHLLLYDGECGLCHGLVRLVLARDRQRAFHFAALQSAVAAALLRPFGGTPTDLTTFYLLENYRGGAPTLRSRADAAFRVAESLGFPWSAVSLLRLLPRAWADAAYDVVARHRHVILGHAGNCLVPRPEHRARFLDSNEAPAP